MTGATPVSEETPWGINAHKCSKRGERERERERRENAKMRKDATVREKENARVREDAGVRERENAG